MFVNVASENGESKLPSSQPYHSVEMNTSGNKLTKINTLINATRRLMIAIEIKYLIILESSITDEGVLSEGVLSGRSLCTDGVMYGGGFVRGGFVRRGFCPEGVLSAHRVCGSSYDRLGMRTGYVSSGLPSFFVFCLNIYRTKEMSIYLQTVERWLLCGKMFS